jgi:hypothetical protein
VRNNSHPDDRPASSALDRVAALLDDDDWCATAKNGHGTTEVVA